MFEQRITDGSLILERHYVEPPIFVSICICSRDYMLSNLETIGRILAVLGIFYPII